MPCGRSTDINTSVLHGWIWNRSSSPKKRMLFQHQRKFIWIHGISPVIAFLSRPTWSGTIRHVPNLPNVLVPSITWWNRSLSFPRLVHVQLLTYQQGFRYILHVKSYPLERGESISLRISLGFASPFSDSDTFASFDWTSFVRSLGACASCARCPPLF